ncbi:hypothetical protein ACNHGM_004343 [Escherichia coli]|jgi:hypothetical protein|nr:hypothetical protein [Escherichia coli]
MVSEYNEKGVTLIEAAFVLMLFCFVFTLSVYYIHLTLIVSKSLSLGQAMNSVGSQLERIIKSGECECTTSTDSDCKKCLTAKMNSSDEIKKLSISGGLRVAIRPGSSGVGILIYTTDQLTKGGTFFTSLDEIYFTVAGTKEKAVIINYDGTITTPAKIRIAGSEPLLTLKSFGIAGPGGPSFMYPGIYFEVPVVNGA